MQSTEQSAQQRVVPVFHQVEKAFTFYALQDSSIAVNQYTPVCPLFFLLLKECEFIHVECMVENWVES